MRSGKVNDCLSVCPQVSCLPDDPKEHSGDDNSRRNSRSPREAGFSVAWRLFISGHDLVLLPQWPTSFGWWGYRNAELPINEKRSSCGSSGGLIGGLRPQADLQCAEI